MHTTTIKYTLKSNAVFIAMIGSLNSNANMQETSLHEFSCNTESMPWQNATNTCPSNQLCTENSGGHYTSFVAMCRLLLSIITWIQVASEKKMTKALASWNSTSCYITNQQLALSAKRTGTQKKTEVTPWYLPCSYYGWLFLTNTAMVVTVYWGSHTYIEV